MYFISWRQKLPTKGQRVYRTRLYVDQIRSDQGAIKNKDDTWIDMESIYAIYTTLGLTVIYISKIE